MTKPSTNLSSYTTGDYHPGAGLLKRAFWYLTNVIIFLNPVCTWYGLKRSVLRCYGANVGQGVVIKPRVNIKYPWNLRIGNNTWIGEKTWIDSLGKISIGAHSCVSQGSMLICGNHNYKLSSFDLMIGDISLEDGVWVGAGAIVGPGTTMESHSVLTAGSVAGGLLGPYRVYGGNPAKFIRERKMSD